MNYGILFCILLAHVAADFVFQNDQIVKMRNCEKIRVIIKGNLIHSIIVLITTIACTLFYILKYLSLYLLIYIFLVALFHFIIDLVKSFFIRIKPFIKYSIIYFFLDQLIHDIIIFIISAVISQRISNIPITVSSLQLLIHNIKNINITHNEKIVLAILLLTIGLWGVGVFIRLFFNYRDLKPYKNIINNKIQIKKSLIKTGATDGGFIIGILERLLIIFIIALSKPEIIGFVLTTKSIARFKKFDDDYFVENFIIGTFISFICAMFVGGIIKKLHVIYY